MTAAGHPLPARRFAMHFSVENLLALFTGIVTTLGGVFAWVIKRGESIDARLQRWQEQTVQRFAGENAELLREVLGLRRAVNRTTHLELALRLAVDELVRHAPDSPALLLVHDVLAVAYPVGIEASEDMADIIAKLRGLK